MVGWVRARWILVGVAFATAAAGVFMACGDESFTANAADAGGDGGGATTSDAGASDSAASRDGADATPPAGPCPPDMVLLKNIAGRGYCIDRHEVTQAEYQTFLQANVAKSTQPAYCSWNDDWEPPLSAACNVDPNTRPAYPIVCVDWCDARAYCAWKGKRLCGNLTDGGIEPDGKPIGEWAAACSQNGRRDFPYGDGGYDPSACNVLEKRDGAVARVDEDPACTGPGDAIDLIGNVKEWVAECAPLSTFTDDCLAAGGSSGSNGPDASCYRTDNNDIGFQLPDIGIRCCANATE